MNQSVNKNCHQFLVNDYFRNSQNTICVIKNNYVNSTVKLIDSKNRWVLKKKTM